MRKRLLLWMVPCFFTGQPCAEADSSQATQRQPVYIHHDSYRWWTWPSVSSSLGTAYVARQSEASHWQTTYRQEARFDLFSHALRWRYRATADHASHHVRLSRHFGALKLFGSHPHSLSYRIGDIDVITDPLIQRRARGLGYGFELANAGRTQPKNSVTITESAPPGWLVELYRDGELLGALYPDPLRGAVFEGITLLPGDNQFRIELTGPSGERETRYQRQLGGRQQAGRPGWRVRGFSLLADSCLYGCSAPGGDPKIPRRMLQLAYHWTNHWQTGIAFHQQGAAGNVASFWQYQLSRSGDKGEWDLRYALQQGAGAALYLAGTWQWRKGYQLSLRHRQASHFTSKALNVAASERYQYSQLTLTGKGADVGGLRHWRLKLDRRWVDDSRHRYGVQASATTQWKRLRNTVSLRQRDWSDLDSQSASWSSLLPLARWKLEAGFDWYRRPEDDQRRWHLGASRRWSKLSWKVNASIDNSHSPVWLINQRAVYRHEKFVLHTGWSHSSRSGSRLSMRIEFGFSLNPITKQPYLLSRRASQGGVIVPQLFLDQNRNGLREADEPPLADIGFLSPKLSGQRTDASGQLMITAAKRQTLAVDPATLPSIYWRPLYQSMQVNTHPGGVTHVPVPVIDDCAAAIVHCRLD